jgi:toxin ParE1/3/4
MIVEIDARDELLAAVIWYEEQREGLGAEFLAAVDHALALVVEAPDSFPGDRFDARARRALVSRFPYAVVFVVQGCEVRIVAFAHAKRLPGYWMKEP